LPGRRHSSRSAGFAVPIGERTYDKQPISATVEAVAEGAEMNAPKKKLKVATTSLAGCFGCHMSFLDIDERLFTLLEHIEFDRSPLTDIKTCSPDCDIGIIEGGLCNAENVHVLREFRKNCKILIAIGACAINGGLPAQRNHLPLTTILEEVYHTSPGLANGMIPNDPELPLPLNKVHPIHEVVKVDYFMPGCPPSAMRSGRC
jgi:NAD-reducing hydrogenase small subunit